MTLEELDSPLVLLCRFPRLECSQIPPPARLGIFLAGIKPKLSGWKFANHTSIIAHPGGAKIAAKIRG
jgi:hypothetical protein